MAHRSYYNGLKFVAAQAGTGSWTVGSTPAGFRSPTDAAVADGAIVRYSARLGTTQWENGNMVYDAGTGTFARVPLEGSSSLPVSFTSPPTVRGDVLAQSVFADDDDLTWTPGSGMLNRRHAAVGNSAAIDAARYAPGDPVNDTASYAGSFGLLINEEFAGDLSAFNTWGAVALEILPGFQHVRSPDLAAGYLVGADIEPTINSDSTGTISDFEGLVVVPVNYGSGDIGSMNAITAILEQRGSGDGSIVRALQFQVRQHGAGNYSVVAGMLGTNNNFAGHVATQLGMYTAVGVNGGTVDLARGLLIDPLIGHPGNYAGLYVREQTGAGTDYSYNILSEDADYAGPLASVAGGNLFQGHSAFGSHSDVDTYGFAPGDPVNEFHAAYPAALQISEAFDSSDGVSVAGVVSYPSFKNGSIFQTTLTGIDNEPSIRSDNTGPVNLIGQFNGPISFGGGVVNTFTGLINNPQQYGDDVTQNVVTAILNRVDLFPTGASIVGSVFCADNVLAAGNNVNIDNATMFNINYPVGGNYGQLFGLYVDRMENAGGINQCYNIVSASPEYLGTMASVVGGNLFQGKTAFGNYADVGTPTFAAGDTGGNAAPFSDDYRHVFNDFFSGNLVNPEQVIIYPSFKQTGSGGILAAMDVEPAIVAQSTGDIDQLYGMAVFPTNYGSGDVGSIVAINGISINRGGHVGSLVGLDYEVWNQGSGDVTDAIAITAGVQYLGTSTTTHGAAILIPSAAHAGLATIHNHYGLRIEDQSGIGDTSSLNIWSKGAGSVNHLEGIISLGHAVNSAPVEGDLWYDGTHLVFHDGAVSHNIT